jgi:hypothetical protein
MALHEQLAEAQKINLKLTALLNGDYKDERREMITLLFFHSSLDHHDAIVHLMGQKMYGSALALVRTVFESMLRAHWIVGCASDAEVDSFADDPKFDLMSRCDADKIDLKFQTDDFFRKMKDAAWAAMNAYTHTGRRQLASQLDGLTVKANYNEQDLKAGLKSATASILLLGFLLARLTNRTKEATEIETLFSFGNPEARVT